MCAPVTWVTEYVLLMLTMQLKFMQLNKNRTSPYDADLINNLIDCGADLIDNLIDYDILSGFELLSFR